jgi:hypothetical protein
LPLRCHGADKRALIYRAPKRKLKFPLAHTRHYAGNFFLLT